VLPQTQLDQAVALAEKLRRCIAEENLPVVGNKTCSFGVATHHSGDTMTSLLGRADEALYDAKKMGRNRVRVKMPL
jgi:diguanylate cyclase (GGDEF)-like protein